MTEFTLINGGFSYVNDPDFHMLRRTGMPEYLLILTLRPAIFVIAGKRQAIRANSLILIDHDTPYEYWSHSNLYQDSWLHFDCNATMLAQVRLNVFTPLPDAPRLNTIIQQILYEHTYATANAAVNIDLLLHYLLNTLQNDQHHSNQGVFWGTHYGQLRALRLTIQTRPGESYTAVDCAKQLDVSIGHFQHLYKKAFGISFQQDVIHMRVEHAKYLLDHSELALSAVAAACGYTSDVHFYRQFKAVMHATPNEYRQHPVPAPKPIQSLDRRYWPKQTD